MAAQATAQPTGSARKRQQEPPQVQQPPRTILRGGERVDISHLGGDDLYEALITDEERWGYSRLSAETGRTVARIRKWVVNVGIAERTGVAPDDRTFIAPHGYFEGSPWWTAGEARRVLIQMGGVMDRAGVMIRHKPTGRTPGAVDTAPRRWSHAPMRDTAVDVYKEYIELTTRRRNKLSDREARAELCERHNLNRTQLARRINTGRELLEAKKGKRTEPVEVDPAALRARLAELVAEKKNAGYSDRGASERARAALAEETGLTRRQIAGYTAAVESAATDKTG